MFCVWIGPYTHYAHTTTHTHTHTHTLTHMYTCKAKVWARNVEEMLKSSWSVQKTCITYTHSLNINFYPSSLSFSLSLSRTCMHVYSKCWRKTHWKGTTSGQKNVDYIYTDTHKHAHTRTHTKTHARTHKFIQQKYEQDMLKKRKKWQKLFSKYPGNTYLQV